MMLELSGQSTSFVGTRIMPTIAPKPQSRVRLVGGLGLVLALTCLGIGLASLVFSGLGSSMAESAESQQKLQPSPIDADRAYGYLKTICAIGPRTAGSVANTRQRNLVAAHFKKYGATVEEQSFAGKDPVSGSPVQMANLIGSWFPERTERVMLGVHYDTRPYPDEDPNPANRLKPFIGANDGASGVALLMEIAHHLTDSGTPWGVDLVLFDGEELVYGGGQNQTGDYFLGSKYFAKVYATARRAKSDEKHYEAALVLDMVGDKNLNIDREPYSLEFAPGLVRDVWAVAKSLKISQFRSGTGRAVYDDHLPLNDAGIPAIDIIDFDYPHWHTAHDIPENCSGESLAQVGKVVTAWLNKPKIAKRR